MNSAPIHTYASFTMPNSHLTHDEVCRPPPLPSLQIPPGYVYSHILQFFDKLGELFKFRKGKDHGSVFLTQKRRKKLLPFRQLQCSPWTFVVVPICAVSCKPANCSSVTFGTGASVPTKEDPSADITTLLSNDDSPSNTTFPVIVHATDGKGHELRKDGKGYQVRKDGMKVKLSTVIDSDALDAFYARYAEICKAGMVALKPRDRTKNKRKTKGKKKKSAAA